MSSTCEHCERGIAREINFGAVMHRIDGEVVAWIPCTKPGLLKIRATNRSPLRIFVRAELAADGTLELDLRTISSHPRVDSNDVPAHDSAEIKIYQGGQ